LAERGHQVTAYGRTEWVPAGITSFRGITIRRLPTVRRKYLDTVVHTALSVVDGLVRGYDVVLICNAANAPLALVPRLAGAHVVLNVDGLEWRRRKWGLLGRTYYRACSWLAARLPIALVTDAQVIASYYRDHLHRATTVIPYGSDAVRRPPGGTLETYKLPPDGYLLYVSRLEPENNALAVIDGYARSGLGPAVPLLVVGDAPYASEYKRLVLQRAAETPGVRTAGYIFGPAYAELQSNAAIYVQATEVGGTHPALVEAMGRGAAIVAHDVPEHHEVLGEAGLYVDVKDPLELGRTLRSLFDDAARRAALGRLATGRARAHYSWEAVADRYEQLFEKAMR
jgi:glycosyltransferase involved in cell wall biosynthesis